MIRHIGFCKDFNAGFTLAEVLITLGIIGVVASITMPAVITKFENKRNVTILKRAYTDLQIYVKDFMIKNDCGDRMYNCWSGDYEALVEFQKYLAEKQNFHLMNPDPYEPSYVQYDKGTIGVSYPFSYQHASRYLGSPTGSYAYFLSGFPFDNYYNIKGDTFRARVHIMTDMRRSGISSDKIPKMSKNMFEAFILNSGKVIPNGYFECINTASWTYYCNTLKNVPCEPVNGNSSTCLGQIISDGWQIKYKY